ncbi:hypothetical protein AOLI_G00060030 [Acnodon oligacanthus]
MADEEDTREVLFPQWMGADKHGLTIEQKAQGEIFIKEVKEESPAAHTGRVFEGDQIVGATIYFENMSSEETADLLKTLNRHKVGLKLQHKTGEKSPCRSPMGTLSWEGRSGFGGSSPDIILSGDDEDYKRIYTKKIKPRLKSEDLAEGVDVRTERHSSTSSDGSTITTITRRITTYTVDIPGASGQQQIDISNPEFKIHVSQHEQQEGSSGQIRLPHGSLISKVGAQEGVDVGEGDADVSVPKIEGDIKSPKVDIECPGVDIKSPDLDFDGSSGKFKGPKFKIPSVSGPKISMPDVDFKLKGHKMKSDMEMSVPTVEGDIAVPKVEIEGPKVDLDVPEASLKKPKFKMPKFGLRGPKIEGPDVEVKPAKGDINVDVKSPEGGFKLPKFKMPKFGFKSPKADMPSVEINMPEADIDIKAPDVNIKSPSVDLEGPKLKGDMDVSASKTEVGIKTPKVDIERPDVSIEGPEGGFQIPRIKVPSFGIRGPKMEGSDVDINLAKAEADIKGPGINIKAPKITGKGPDIDSSLEGQDVEINLKGKKDKFKMPKLKGKMKTDIDINTKTDSAELDVDSSDVHLKGPKVKKPLFGKLHFPGVEFDIKSPKGKGGSVSGTSKSVSGTLKGSVEGGVKDHTIDAEGVKIEAEAQDVELKMPAVKVKLPHGVSTDQKQGEIGVSTDVGVSGKMECPEGNVSFPKIKVPKFGIALPQVEGREVGVDVGSGELTARTDVSSQSLEMHSPDLKSSGGKVKVKKPRFFGKSKTKGGSAADLTFQGPEIAFTSEGGAKVSKELSLSSGQLIGGKMVEGGSGLKISPKSKSASLDLYKKSRHRSSSLSDEGELASPTSVEGHLETEGGNISVDVGDAKVKGKKGKLKFGTFGGFGSKSKGSYEVTLGDDSEAKIEGASGGDLLSKKSRVSSSSSSDSGSKGGFRFPRVEIAVSPKK